VVIIARAPYIIEASGFFTVDISYSTSGAHQIAVQLIDESKTNYAKGVASISDKGTASVKVVIFSTLELGKTYTLRASIVPQGYGNQPEGYELDTDEMNVLAGDKISYEGGTTNSTMEGSSALSLHSVQSESPIFLLSLLGAIAALIM